MTSQNPRLHIYDPKTLALMDQAFAAIWNQVAAVIEGGREVENRQVDWIAWAQAFCRSSNWCLSL